VLIGALELKIYLPAAFSLKDKRSVIKSLLEKTKNRFNLAAAEVGENDLWKNARIAVVTVSSSQQLIEKQLDQYLRFVEEFPGLQLLSYEKYYY